MPEPAILIIEDDPAIRRLLDIALQANGFQTRHAATAREGKTEVAMHQPALVLLDLGLPDADGQTLHRDQKLQQYRTQVAYHTARRRVRSVKILVAPTRAQRTLEQRIEEENTEW